MPDPEQWAQVDQPLNLAIDQTLTYDSFTSETYETYNSLRISAPSWAAEAELTE